MSRAMYEIKSASLASEFGESYARRLLGDEAVDNMPRYVRGPKKGRPKGRLVWRKCPEQVFAEYNAPYFAHGKEFPVQSSPDWWRYS